MAKNILSEIITNSLFPQDPKMSYLETKLKSDCYREPRLNYRDVFKSIADLGHLRPLALFLPPLDQLSLSRPLPSSSS